MSIAATALSASASACARDVVGRGRVERKDELLELLLPHQTESN